jgi:adenylate kinase
MRKITKSLMSVIIASAFLSQGVLCAGPGLSLRAQAFSQRAGSRQPAAAKPLWIAIIGLPASGKTTSANHLYGKYGLVPIPIGQLIRDEVVDKNSELGQKAEPFVRQGQLVPSDISKAILLKKIESVGTQEGFVLDGMPRNMADVEMLSELGIKLDGVIRLYAPGDEAGEIFIRRIAERRKKAEALYRKGQGKPPRADDVPEIARRRVDSFRMLERPVAAHFRRREKLIDVEATGTREDMLRMVEAAVSKIRLRRDMETEKPIGATEAQI